jgi:hypothetical protein
MKCINLLVLFSLSVCCMGQIPMLDPYYNPLPAVVTPGSLSPDGGMSAPSDAIPLFNGKDLSEWKGKDGTPQWTVHDGMVTVKEGTGDISTKREFGDFQLHIEWMHPANITGEDQMRGNSGIYLHDLYEIQVLDNYNNNNKTYVNGQAGAIYKQHSPLVNPLREPGKWNAVDVIFTAPTFNPNGTYRTNPLVTVLLNGVLIHNNAVIYGATASDKVVEKLKGGITLQDHGCEVNYRNIWIREL